MQSLSFHRSERLKSKKTISLLFQKGRTIRENPFRIRWVCIPNNADALVQSTFSIPKRIHPKAVTRNRIKRIIKEAYRLHKHDLYSAINVSPDKQFALIFIYQEKVIPDFQTIEKAILKILPKIAVAFNDYQPSSNQQRFQIKKKNQ